MLYMVTFTINIPQMLAYIPYMDPMGYIPRVALFCRGIDSCHNEKPNQTARAPDSS